MRLKTLYELSGKGRVWHSSKETQYIINLDETRAHMEGKQRDDEWIADFATMCFSGNALRWYETLDDDVQRDWSKLRRAILDWLPDTGSRSVVPR